MMRLKAANNEGFTLIEIVMVIVILGVIGAFTFQFVAHGVQAFKKSSARKDLYDQGRLALERMVRELRDTKQVTGSASSSITFKKAHPAQAADNTEEVKFELNGTNLERVGDPSGTPATAVLASNVSSFTATYGGGVGGGGGSCSASPTAYSGSVSTTYNVPADCDTLTVKAWGAGGGGGGSAGQAGGAGGGGGFAQSDISVTPGENLGIEIGGGGAGSTGNSGGDGGDGGGGGAPSAGGGAGGAADNPQGGTGGGGGYSAVKRGATFLVQAAGGGGGGAGEDTAGGAGGAGGGDSGVAGGAGADGAGGGGGGTQAAGGTAGAAGSGGGAGNAGTANTGGAGANGTGGGGGGAGLYGGGGGGGDDDGGAGGGGGSSLGTIKTAGSGTNAGNTGDTDYANNAGQGGAAGTGGGAGGNGNPGRVVITSGGGGGGGGTTLFSDDFEDGVITGWSQSGEIMEESGGVFQTPDGNNQTTHYTVDSGSAWTDYTFSVRVKSVDNDQLGISFRVQDTSNYYLLTQNFGDSSHGGSWNLRLQKVVGGTETDLGSSPIYNYGSSAGQVDSRSTWYTLKVELSGPSIKVYVDDVLKYDITDSTYSTGTVGLWLESEEDTEFDDVLVQSSDGGNLVTLEITLSSSEGGTVSMRTMVYLRNVP